MSQETNSTCLRCIHLLKGPDHECDYEGPFKRQKGKGMPSNAQLHPPKPDQGKGKELSYLVCKLEADLQAIPDKTVRMRRIFQLMEEGNICNKYEGEPSLTDIEPPSEDHSIPGSAHSANWLDRIFRRRIS